MVGEVSSEIIGRRNGKLTIDKAYGSLEGGRIVEDDLF